MEFVRREAPYLAPKVDVASMMLQVLLALIPAAIAHVWYFGPGFIFNLIVATAFCVGGEYLMMNASGRDPMVAVSDLSAIVTAALLAFALPTLTPWWVTATGSLFAIVVVKHLYGGITMAPEVQVIQQRKSGEQTGDWSLNSTVTVAPDVEGLRKAAERKADDEVAEPQ